MISIDTINLIPNESIPRFQSDKRMWLDPVEFQIEKVNEGYKISFLSTRGMGKRRFFEILPQRIEVNDNFKCALVAYMCEGTDLRKGIYTKNSGNKGKNISFTNTDSWLIRLVIDEFQKIGIRRERWKARLDLYPQHDNETEKLWWSTNLNIPLNNFKIRSRPKGQEGKESYAIHGICVIECWSVIFSAIIDNLINLLKEGKEVLDSPVI